jgi:hypothetical protein
VSEAQLRPRRPNSLPDTPNNWKLCWNKYRVKLLMKKQRRTHELLSLEDLLVQTTLLRKEQKPKDAVESWLKLGSPQKRSAVVPYEQVWRVWLSEAWVGLVPVPVQKMSAYTQSKRLRANAPLLRWIG